MAEACGDRARRNRLHDGDTVDDANGGDSHGGVLLGGGHTIAH